MLLAVLLCEANQVVTTDRLIEELWGNHPPQSAPKLLQSYISRLRRALTDDTGHTLTTHVHGYRAHGYRLIVGPGELDAHRFDDLITQARRELDRNNPNTAATHLTQALDLWRDTPFADVPPTPAIETETQRLHACCTQARELRIEARLRLGHHQALLEELHTLTTQHPLREGLRGQLMLALYRSGRQADALAAYRDLHHRLTHELGIEPGPPLQQLHQRILNADPTLLTHYAQPTVAKRTPQPAQHRPVLPASGPRPGPRHTAVRTPAPTVQVPRGQAFQNTGTRQAYAAPAPRPDAARTGTARTPAARPSGWVVPRELPHTTTTFTGRTSESLVLRRLLDRGADDPRSVAIAVIDGIGGVGKSALAIHTAHQVAHRFPDGQLYVDLHGATAGLTPLKPGDVLSRFLTALGVRQAAIPGNTEEAAAKFRSMVADRRLLVVLDNAASVEQVRPLLPAGRGCAVLITSREILGALDGASYLHLGMLFHNQAHALLERLIGADRVAAEPEAADAIIDMCGGLPLALQIVGARLAARPSWPLSALVERLSDAQSRLDEIRVGDISVRASFHASYEAICNSGNPTDQAAARAFRLLGAIPGPTISLPAAAALLDAPAGPAEDALERLVDAHLLTSPAPARYQMHDLLRLFAREQITTEETTAEHEAALERVLRFYLATTRRAVAFLDLPPQPAPEANWHRPFDLPGSAAGQAPRIRNRSEAEAWLDAERTNLMATVTHAATCSDAIARLAIQLTQPLQWYLYPQGRARELRVLGELAIRTARRLGDRVGEAWGLDNLSSVYWLHGRYDWARQCLESALAIWHETGDSYGEQRSLCNLADILAELNLPEEAVPVQLRQLELARRTGDRFAQLTGLGNLARAYRDLGRIDDALTCLHKSLELAKELGDTTLESFALNEISLVLMDQGRYAEGQEMLLRAVNTFEPSAYVRWRGYAWSALFPSCLRLPLGPQAIGAPP